MARKAIMCSGAQPLNTSASHNLGLVGFALGWPVVAAMVVEEGDGEEVVAAVVSLIGSSSMSSL
jgi:hypothetical protein